MQYEALHRGPFWTTGTFWVTVAVVLFLLAFGGAIVRAIVAMVDARSDRIRASLLEAQRLRQDAEEMLKAAEARQTEAIEMAREITAGAQARAARLAEDLAREAKLTQARREKVVADRITAAEASAVTEVRHAAAALAVEAVTRLLSETLDANEDAAMIDAAIAGLPAQLAPRRAA